MNRYPSAKEFHREMKNLISAKGLLAGYIDIFHIQVLWEYRIAAAFAVSALSMVEAVDEKLSAVIKKTVAACEDVLKDSSVYVIDEWSVQENSKLLDDAVKKADKAIAEAGNLCNNIADLVRGKFQTAILRARDICDAATRRMRIGS